MNNLSITEDKETNFFSVSWNTEDKNTGFIFTRYEDGEITFWRGTNKYAKHNPNYTEYITTKTSNNALEVSGKFIR